jgi:xylulokinase
MRERGLSIHIVRAGRANMFLSPLFRKAFTNTVNARLELFNTDGAVGAARGAGVGAGFYPSLSDAFVGLETETILEPERDLVSSYAECYTRWKEGLRKYLSTME